MIPDETIRAMLQDAAVDRGEDRAKAGHPALIVGSIGSQRATCVK